MDSDTEQSSILQSDAIISANIMKWVSERKVLKLRLVSRSWNQGFLMAHLHRFTVHVVQKEPQIFGDTIEGLLNSTVQWQRYTFKDVDMKSNPQYAVALEVCFQQSKSSIKSIHFINCQITMGQIFLLGSIPEPVKFEEFRVIDCTGPYSGGLEVMAFWKHMKPFHENVQNLKRLELVDSKNQLNPLEVWIGKSTGLVELKSAMVVSPINENVLRDIFVRNSATLTSISLAYMDLVEALDGMAKLKLKHLELKNCKIPNPVRFSGFIKNQSLLKSMRYENIQFKNLSFSYAKSCISLETLHFENCEFDPTVLAPFHVVRTLKDVTFIGKSSSLEEINGFTNQPKKRMHMNRLVLNLGEGTDALFVDIGQNFPNLEEFESHGIGTVNMENLSHIWKLKKLTRLCLTDCELKGFTLSPLNMSNLQSLEVLDLSDTNANDETISQVVNLKYIRKMRLRNTLITEFGLSIILQNFHKELEEFDVRGCPLCRIVPKSLEIYNGGLQYCELECDLDMDDGEEKEPYLSFESDDEDRESDSESDADDEEKTNIGIVSNILQEDVQDQHARALAIFMENPELLDDADAATLQETFENVGLNPEYFVEEPEEDGVN